MKIFADTANIEELKELMSWGVIDGCTTNPSIVFKEGNIDFEEHMKKVLEIIPGPVSIEVTTEEVDGMVTQSGKFAQWGDHVVVKIPMGVNGLKATKILKAAGIKTNVTACMNMPQAVLAAKAGATYVSLFWGRIEDMGYDAKSVVEDTMEAFDEEDFKAEIILGSIRTVSDVCRAINSGAHVLTIPTPVLKKLPFHPRTKTTLEEFMANWQKFEELKK